VLLCGPDTQRIESVLDVALGAQADLGDADWALPTTGSAILSKHGAQDYRLTTTRAQIRLPGGRDLRWTSRHAIDVSDGFGGAGAYGSAAVVLDAAHFDEAAAGFLRNAALELAAGRPKHLRRLIILITDALALLERQLPPIDAMDAWDLVRSGEPLGRAPIVRAREAGAWSAIVEKVDKGWGRPLRQLARAAQERGAQTGLIAVSASGFYPRTGMVAKPGASGSDRIVFNLRLLTQALSPHVGITLPQPFVSP
jgi:hypothetical protein